MPSWDDEESSQDSLLSDFNYGHHLSPRKPILETILDPEYTGYDDCDLRCKHDMSMYKFVCFEGENTGRKFLACGCKDEDMCDKVQWVDGPLPPPLQKILVKLWAMHDEERDSRIHDLGGANAVLAVADPSFVLFGAAMLQPVEEPIEEPVA
ncbi:hypothetical protein ACQ4PT_048220 [Festuca glaucescens]